MSDFSLQEADLGFHLIIDRRTDKWNSVKTVLLKISVSTCTNEVIIHIFQSRLMALFLFYFFYFFN